MKVLDLLLDALQRLGRGGRALRRRILPVESAASQVRVRLVGGHPAACGQYPRQVQHKAGPQRRAGAGEAHLVPRAPLQRAQLLRRAEAGSGAPRGPAGFWGRLTVVLQRCSGA